MTESYAPFANADIHELLATRRSIGDIWSTEDVQSVREDLSDDQAWQVLLLCQREHDPNHGINWTIITEAAERLFPEPVE